MGVVCHMSQAVKTLANILTGIAARVEATLSSSEAREESAVRISRGLVAGFDRSNLVSLAYDPAIPG